MSRRSLHALVAILGALAAPAWAEDALQQARTWLLSEQSRLASQIAMHETTVSGLEADQRTVDGIEASARQSGDAAALQLVQESRSTNRQAIDTERRILRLLHKKLADTGNLVSRLPAEWPDKAKAYLVRSPGVRITTADGAPRDGQMLAAGDRIETGPGETADVFVNGGNGRVHLNEQTDFRIDDNSEQSFAAMLKTGVARISARVNKLRRKFEVRTPSAICGVRGTDFSMAVSGESTRIRVEDGHVLCQPDTDQPPLDIPAGQQAVYRQGASAPTAATPFDPQTLDGDADDAPSAR